MDTPFELPIRVRYYEVDQQGVVFNGWFLMYWDEAMTAWLEAGGLPYEAMTGRGYDVQLIHNETTWRLPVRWQDDLRVRVEVGRVGTTSFALHFTAVVDGEERVTSTTTYVVVATDGAGKRTIPAFLCDVLAR